MIIIIFILLIVTIYLIKYFEKKRDERNEAIFEKRKEQYTRLLQSLKEKESSENKNINEL